MRNCKPEKEKIVEIFDYDNALKKQQKQMRDNFKEKLKAYDVLASTEREKTKLKEKKANEWYSAIHLD